MGNTLLAAASRLRTVPLVLTVLALMGGVLGMHIFAGGHGTGDHGPTSGNATAVVLQAGGGSPAHPQTVPSNHQDHHGVEATSSSPPVLPYPGGAETGPGAAESILQSHTECHQSCPEMIVLSCVLALTLLGLAVLPRRTFYLRLPVPRISMPALLLLYKSITPTGPSPVQLSISRT